MCIQIKVLKGKPSQTQSETPSKKRKHKEELKDSEPVGLLDVPRVVEMLKVALKDFLEKRLENNLQTVLG